VGVANGRIPAGAVHAGNENGQPVYVARADQDGGLHPGKAVAAPDTCYISMHGAEYSLMQYQVKRKRLLPLI